MLVLICWANTIHGPNLLHMAPPRQVTAALLIRLIKICKGEEFGGKTHAARQKWELELDHAFCERHRIRIRFQN